MTTTIETIKGQAYIVTRIPVDLPLIDEHIETKYSSFSVSEKEYLRASIINLLARSQSESTTDTISYYADRVVLKEMSHLIHVEA